MTTIPVIKKVFVATNGGSKYNGNLGAVTGATSADAKCTAAQGSLTGTFYAWISDATTTYQPSTRFSGVGGSYRYVLPSGTVIANGWADLTDGTLAAGINQDASGTAVANGNVWTNVTSAGARDGATSNTHACTAWTSNLNTRSANVGTSGSTTASWTDTGGTATCNTTAYLYCFQQ